MSACAEDAVAILLAAGRSRRLGRDKLIAEFAGRPVIDHIAETLAGLPFARRIAVTPADDNARAERLAVFGDAFAVIRNSDPDAGQGASLACAAAQVSAAPVVVILADMPFVTVDHIGRLLAALPDHPRGAAITAGDDVRMPPVAFATGWLPDLAALSGDRGARALLADAAHVAEVAAPARMLIDLDTEEDFARARG